MRAVAGIKAAGGFLLFGGVLLLGSGSALAINTITDYQKSPAFVTTPVQPLTMLMLDNTGSMGFDAYSGTYDATKKYYGLFETHSAGSPTVADIYYYHPNNIAGSTSVCNYTSISGTCIVPDPGGTGTCSYPMRTCTTSSGGGAYTCFRADRTVAEFTTTNCDGPDSDTSSDCRGGSSDCDYLRTSRTYTCRSVVNDVTDGNKYTESSNCDGPDSGNTSDCLSGYSCTYAYHCGNSGTTIYGESSCDANNDGNTDCPSGSSNSCRRWTYNSGDRDYRTCSNPGGNEDSGSYLTSNCDSSCSGGASCVSLGNVNYYSCQTDESGTNDDYANATCDGADANSSTDCPSGYACVTAYQCTKSGQTTKYFPTSGCDTYQDLTGSDVRCRESDGWTCSPTVTPVVENWTGQPCSTCEASPKSGVCADTGSYTIPNYNCVANSALCDSYALAGSVCTATSQVDVCEWTELVQKAVCQGLCGGTLVDVPGGASQAPCTTATQQADCVNKYGSVCEIETTYSGGRAAYWSKTPADATHPLGWNCNTGDCVGSGANVTLGNKLNFDQMTQMDVAKKVLIGGKRTTSIWVADGATLKERVQLDGDYNQTSTQYLCSTNGVLYSSSSNCRNATGCSSSTCTSVTSGNNGNILLQVGEDPKGLLQNNEGLAWGFGVFKAPDGGRIVNYIGSPNADIVKSINDTPSSGYTDVAESLNTVVNYFRQVTPYYTAGEYTVDTPPGAGIWDPFVDDLSKSFAPCGRASTILITDGEPNQDDKFDAAIKNYANNNSSGITDFISPTSGTNTYFVDDVAYWAHKNDLRTEAEMGGPQMLDIYMIYAFGNDAASKLKLQNAAVLGGFTDKNNDGKPNSKAAEAAAVGDNKEWDTDGDTIPDNYAEASDGEVLASKLQNMLGQIQQKVSAGSAASVISASRSGEGAIYQAIFYPKTPPDSEFRKITWVGDVHALWLDDYGNMRADCGAADTGDSCAGTDATLNLKTDKILEFYSDPTNGEAMVRTFRDSNGDSKYIAGSCSVALAKGVYEAREFDCLAKGGVWSTAGTPDFISNMAMKDFSHYLWSGGSRLANASAAQKSAYSSTAAERYIFTQKEDVTGKPVSKAFTAEALQAAFGVSYPSYLNAASTTEADKIVNYVRGVDDPAYRSRLYDWGWGDGADIQKMGDVVGSTPTIVAKPAEDYDLLYLDKSYHKFRKAHDQRRIMVYSGGNDGGLHAYNGGYYDRSQKKFLDMPPGKAAYALGSEMWMFIPKNLLPHLKWLTDVNYPHVYYSDLKPYVFDAKIFSPDATHVEGWGTVLVGGMGFGGGDFHIDTNDDGIKDTYLRSSYYILDITDPEKAPVVLAEFSDPGLGFTLGAPTAVPMLRCNNRLSEAAGGCPESATWPMDWYLAFGSGPHNNSVANPNGISTAMRGRSDQAAKLYLLSLGGTSSYVSDGTGVLAVPALVTNYPKDIPAGYPKSFFSDLIAVDYDLNFKTDVLYFGSIANTDKAAGANYTGGMHRLVTGESLIPSTWTLNTFFNATQPVSAAASASWDGSRAWVYFGTGRLLDATDDKSDSSQQSYYGLKERYTVVNGNDHMDLTQPNGGTLVDVSKIWVEQGTGNLYNTDTNGVATLTTTNGVNSPLLAKTFGELNKEIGAREDTGGLDKYHGWKINFPDRDGKPTNGSERNLGQAALLGGVLTFTTYIPSAEICTAEGSSIIWAPYYRTGTAYFKPVLGVADRGGQVESVRESTPVKGMTLTPSLHTGAESGTTALVQTSTGAIVSFKQEAPGTVKSGIISWRDKGAE